MQRSLMRSAVLLALSLAATFVPAAEVANLRNGYSIRHERHESLGNTTRLYLGANDSAGFVDIASAQIESFQPAPPDPATSSAPSAQHDLQSIVREASTRSQIDADFIASVIHAESNGNSQAVSPKGAQGLMQLMPQTAASLGVKNSFDPADNVDGGVRYLRDLLLQYHGDAAKALAAYNAGPQRVQQYGGVPPYRETHAYVARVINDYNRKKVAQQKKAAANPASKSTSQPTDR